MDVYRYEVFTIFIFITYDNENYECIFMVQQLVFSQDVMVVNEGTVGLSGSAVHVVSTAEPIFHRAASSWAHGSLALLLCSHLDQLLLG